MRYLSVCSGIEAATCAWHQLGWMPAAFSEIEKFPSAVLAHHYPNVQNLGDMTRFQEWPDDLAPDVLVGGTPCQSFSVAGLRKGLADPRGNLALVYLAMADKYRPEWLVWENVPGVLSSNGGRDFGSFLGALVELGYGFSYRVLDAQYFGVAQQRRRVFVVANLRDWRRAAAVLFESESLSGNPAPRRETRKDVAPTISARPTGGGGLGTDFDLDGGLIARPTADFIGCLNSIIPATAHTLRGEGFDASEDGTGRGTPLVPVAYGIRTANTSSNGWGIQEEVTHTLDQAQGQAVAVALRGREGGATIELGGEIGHALRASQGGGDKPHVFTGMSIRRLTPVECERLQGFPDGYTDIQPRGKQTPDGPRYKALGNSMAVPVMAWIGKRIAAVAAQEKA